MKRIIYLLLLFPFICFGQAPQGISYQAVAYDSEGFEISNQDISVRLGILLGAVDAEASYTEVHYVTTDDFGMFSLVISEGETSDAFSSINWDEGAYLKVEVDTNLDGEYNIMGVSSFNAVPYALSAPTNDLILSRLNELETMLDFLYLYGCTDVNACNYSPHTTYTHDCAYAEQGYDCEGNLLPIYQVGDLAEGGIVFYVDLTGQHGLVAAMEDLTENATIDGEGTSGYQWGCFAMWLSGADGQAIGTGYQNTLDIASGCSETPIAASEALDYQSENHNDWYLPSLDELKEMYNTIGNGGSEGNIGGFSSNWYWSSSESNNYGAYDVNFSDGSTGNFSSKTKIVRVRPIRSF